MKKIFAVLFCLFFIGLMPLIAIEYELPILTVSGNNQGHFNRIHLEYRNTGKSEPLRVSISDNTPGGSGDTIRTSVWQATITAALLRNNLMSGARITVDFSDFVDGPSAGGVLCLGILSALDNRPFPHDFAMTGTIMPDGTVGLVGGVAYKLRAAARAGIKRACIPEFLRYEKQDDGSTVDLFEEAEKLGIQLQPVAHISEAYAFMHDLPRTSAPLPDERQICQLPEKLKSELTRQYNFYYRNVKQNIARLSDEDREELAPLLGKLIFPPREDLALFDSGKLLTARNNMLVTYWSWLALNKQKKFTQNLLDKSPDFVEKLNSDDRKEQLDGILEYARICNEQQNNFEKKINPEFAQYYPDNDSLSEISAQLEDALFAYKIAGMLYQLGATMQLSEKEIKRLQDERTVSDEEFSQTIENYISVLDFKLFTFFMLNTILEQEAESRVKLASTLPQIRSNKWIEETDQLFYSSWLATDKSLDYNVLSELQTRYSSTRDQIINQLSQVDSSYASYYLSWGPCLIMHRNIKNLGSDLAHKEYHALVSTFASIDLFAQASVLLIKNGPELGMYKDSDGQVQYRNTAFLNYLLRAARLHAMRNIAECQRLNIPCVSSIALFEQAEVNREKSETDKMHDVLELYWRAGFQAKALVLSFKR